MSSGFSLKDQLFNEQKVRYLASLFNAADHAFNADLFTSRVMEQLPDLELKARINWIAEVLDHTLPGQLTDVSSLVLAALPPPLDPAKTDDDFGDFIFAPLGELIVRKGLEAAPEHSLLLLEEVTQRFSMEWSIRPFLARWPELTLEKMSQWVEHPSYHVRRLVSEGTRPRLPWGMSVPLALTDPLPFLDRLHGDPTRYVTRSVANHLNDIAKKEPDLVLERLKDWQSRKVQGQDELAWLTAHACRGLVKAGHGPTMALLGYDPKASISVNAELKSIQVIIGEVLEFSVNLSAETDLPVLVDYRIHFQRPSGKISTKVFKLKQSQLKDGSLTLSKSHRMRGDASTFKLVPGEHRLEILVNGVVQSEASFQLVA